MTRRSRNRVLDDRLWDAEGQEWSCPRGQWASHPDVRNLLRAGGPVCVHGMSRPMMWLTTAEARQEWMHWERYLEVPGKAAADGPDDDGLTYGAKIWRRDGDRRLGIQIFC